MTEQRAQTALTGLQFTLGVVILIEAALFLLPSARDEFARTHLPSVIRYVLGYGEIVGSILLLIPRTTVQGAWLLVAVFALAIAIHLLHGMFNVGDLVIYVAAAWTIAIGKAV